MQNTTFNMGPKETRLFPDVWSSMLFLPKKLFVALSEFDVSGNRLLTSEIMIASRKGIVI